MWFATIACNCGRRCADVHETAVKICCITVAYIVVVLHVVGFAACVEDINFVAVAG